MINESVKASKKEAIVSPVASPAGPQAASRSASPPLVPLGRAAELRREEDTLYTCASSDSLAHLQGSSMEPCAAGASRKYIDEDDSQYFGSSGVYTRHCVRPTRVGCDTAYLRPRTCFTGFQVSGYKRYQVMVTLQTVELPYEGATSTSPHMTGFLTIRGLTNQHPEITTFFEGYAVTDTVGFLSSAMPTELASLKAYDQIDLEHWLNFPSFKELCMQPTTTGDESSSNIMHSVLDGSYSHADYLSNRFIYMRWKEKFLVPDAEIDSVEGASYDGYYYIVHDQITGGVLGFYYHKDAEKFQQLELAPVSNSCCTGDCSFEFN
ncbi:LAMI_0E09934g1_1 [Lachancea mirantina]|uniref:LAMI_0E09934g1_1 n=1 Tax=Lachancea mirantina TaxID=1230905 RepID=A0A1G4JNS3_9SACH|nr:LAMI_0E09934g1_1 [Lachancea mirantina]